MNCMSRTCRPAMKLCNTRCGNDGECFTACENARMDCLKTRCGWTDADAREILTGGDEPCEMVEK